MKSKLPMSSADEAIRDHPALAGSRQSRLSAGAASYCVLLLVFWYIARFFRLQALADYPASTFLSFALLFAPYWLFGFGMADALRSRLSHTWAKIVAGAALALPYPVLTAPQGMFHWQAALVLTLIPVVVTVLLKRFPRPANWADFLVLGTLGLLIDLGLLSHAWPLGLSGAALWPAGLGGFPKMMMANVALYGYLVVKPIDGIGYDLTPRLDDWKNGFREFLLYAPIVLTLGFLLRFITFQGFMTRAQQFPAAWAFTFIFVALPEELFFRGLLQNLLQRHMSRFHALLLASVLFGLSHFNKGATFNWRYVILATIAGVFYGRAWVRQKRLFASSVTHSTVDAAWSIWFR